MNGSENDARESATLSHLTGESGARRSCMVDVGAKEVSAREAVAEALIRFPAGMLAPILAGAGAKGPIEEVARVAGILAAKRTGDLIPMCHPLGLDHVEVLFEVSKGDADCLRVECTARCSGRTGVEMEAMTGASIAALTVYDMTKASSKGIRIEHLRLLSKRGGKSGQWVAETSS